MTLLSIGLLLSLAPGAVGDSPKTNRPDYLEIVTAYADALLDRGRDTYGEEKSPLIAATLDRKTLKLFEGPELERIKNIPQEGWGIRPHDRMASGANPQHDQDLYQSHVATRALRSDYHGRHADDGDLGTLGGEEPPPGPAEVDLQ